MGHYGKCHSDNGLSYRERWDTELAKQGIDAVHGAPYHAQSQGLAEKNADHIKKMICKLGYLRDKEFQEMVWSLNFMASSRPGMGSPAMRLHGRDMQGPLPSPPSSLTEELVQALRR